MQANEAVSDNVTVELNTPLQSLQSALSHPNRAVNLRIVTRVQNKVCKQCVTLVNTSSDEKSAQVPKHLNVCKFLWILEFPNQHIASQPRRCMRFRLIEQRTRQLRPKTFKMMEAKRDEFNAPQSSRPNDSLNKVSLSLQRGMHSSESGKPISRVSETIGEAKEAVGLSIVMQDSQLDRIQFNGHGLITAKYRSLDSVDQAQHLLRLTVNLAAWQKASTAWRAGWCSGKFLLTQDQSS